MNENELLFGFSPYGGHCPQCRSQDTLWWMREILVPDGYNEWEEWYSCNNCKHTWIDHSLEAVNTFLLNNGYTEEHLQQFEERIREALDRLQNDNTDDEHE